MFPRSTVVVFVASIAGTILLSLFAPATVWTNFPVHSTMETAGGIIALVVALLALIRFGQSADGVYLVISSALMVMGLLDLSHACVGMNPAFFWSRALPTVLGGLIIACVWIPALAKRPVISPRLPLFATVAALPICVALVAAPSRWPLMFDQGHYTLGAKAINVVGGAAFLVAAACFVYRYRRSAAREDVTFANQCVLFGIAGILFSVCSMWDAVWWLFHAVRLAAYIVVLRVTADVYRSYEAGLRERLTEQLAAASERLRLYMESSPLAVIEWDIDGVVTGWGKGAARMFGWTPEQMVGRPLNDVPFVGANDRQRLRAAASEDRPYSMIVYTDGARAIQTEWFNSVVTTESGTTVLSLVADVTARAEAEQALRRAKDAAEEANRIKDEFLATVSHELRTPLTTLIGWSGMLKRGGLDETTHEMAIQQIYKSARAQQRMIEDLLELSRVATGKFTLVKSSMDLAPVVAVSVEAFRPHADEKKVTISTDVQGHVAINGDSGRLQQVVSNLLANSVKFTPPGGHVHVRLDTENGDAVIAVTDSGIGISPTFLPLVFDRFRQADGSATRQFGGLGLGLAIVKEIVEAHGGSVQAASAGEGRGATFTVRLPHADAPDGGDAEPAGITVDAGV